jgi:hypothetical protein
MKKCWRLMTERCPLTTSESSAVNLDVLGTRASHDGDFDCRSRPTTSRLSMRELQCQSNTCLPRNAHDLEGSITHAPGYYQLWSLPRPTLGVHFPRLRPRRTLLVTSCMATKTNGTGGWLRGKTVRKGGTASANSHARSTNPQVQSTSTTVFGGGVKDPSGRTTEFFVSCGGKK